MLAGRRFMASVSNNGHRQTPILRRRSRYRMVRLVRGAGIISRVCTTTSTAYVEAVDYLARGWEGPSARLPTHD